LIVKATSQAAACSNRSGCAIQD